MQEKVDEIKSAVAEMIKARSYLNLFKLIATVDSLEPKLKYPTFDALAPMYPTLAKIAIEGEQVKEIAGFYHNAYVNDSSTIEHAFWHAMTWINTQYINMIKCDCGKEVNLFSDTHDTNYNHHEHKVFREWAYKHMPEKRRLELLLPLEELDQ